MSRSAHGVQNRGRRALVLLCAAIAVVALLGLWRPAGASAVCFRVSAADPLDCFKTPTYKYMVLNIVLQGDFNYARVQNGQDQNACGNGSGTTPNSETESFGFDFDVVWYHVKVPFAPVTGSRPTKAYTSGKSTVSGNYLFHGMNYDANCQQVTWPGGGGSDCQGKLAETSQKLGLNLVNYHYNGPQPDKNHIAIDMQPVTLDGLAPTPASCEDTDGQEHTWNEVGGGESPDALVLLNVSNRSLGGRSFVHGPVPLRVSDPAGFVSDCSVPSAQLECHETWTGSAHAYVYRIAVIS